MKKLFSLLFLLCTLCVTAQAQIGGLTCACKPVVSVSVSNITFTSATVSWVPASGQSASCTYLIMVTDLTNSSGSFSTQTSGSFTYNITGLAPGHNYQVSVAINVSGTLGCVGLPVSASFTTPGSYCSSSSTTTGSFITMQYFWFDMNMSSTTNRIWPNGTVVAVPPGAPYVAMPNTVILHKNQTVSNAMGIYFQAHNTTIPPYTIFQNLWVDFDQNGVFDSFEKISSGSLVNSSSTPPALSGYGVSFTSTSFLSPAPIPNITANGLKARLTLSINQNVGPCSFFGEGQVVDFWVNVIP